MIISGNTQTFCRLRLNTLLFSISIMSIVEGISQIILIIKATMPYSTSCDARYTDLQLAINHFSYFHRAGICEPKGLMQFLSDDVEFPNNQVTTYIQFGDYSFRKNSTRVAKFVFVYRNIANLLDSLMIVFNVPLFTASFCTSQLNRCKIILIPWIFVMFFVIIFDLSTMPIIMHNYFRCRTFSGWLRQMEFDYRVYYSAASFDGIASPFIGKYLVNFAEILVAISVRHILTIPFFIVSLVMIIKLCYHLYKLEALEQQAANKTARAKAKTKNTRR